MGPFLSQLIFNLVFGIFPKSGSLQLKGKTPHHHKQTLTKLEINDTPSISSLQVRTTFANVNN